MKIAITGGGSAGNFFPLMAIADAILEESRKQTLVEPRLYYIGPDQHNPKELIERGIGYVYIPAGKRRIHVTGVAVANNIIDVFKTITGCAYSLVRMFSLFPDVICAKSGYASFPVLFAAKILGIPVILHESNSVPDSLSQWVGKFAKKIAVSFPESAEYFDAKKVAFTGNPIRKDVENPLQIGAYEYLGLSPNLPIVTVLGGSQGSPLINDVMMRVIPELTKTCQIIHQAGNEYLKTVIGMSKLALDGSTYPERYKPLGYMSDMVMRMIGSVSRVIVSRAGSSIFEIALWGVPSVLIPIVDTHSDRQRKNAYNYARSGGAVIVEEDNLTPQILIHEIERIVQDEALHEKMSAGAKSFARKDAADIIAREVLNIALSHEV